MSELAVDFLLGSGWTSRLVAYWGNGYGGYSHAASVLDAEHYIDSHVGVIAGVPAGVQIRRIATEKCVKRKRAAIICSLTEYNAWTAALKENLGDPYGDTDIWAFITGRREHTQGQWICSADALRGMRRVNRVPPLSVPDHQITPNSLLLILEAVGFKTYDMPPIT